MRKSILFMIFSIILLMVPLISATKNNDKEQPAPPSPRAVMAVRAEEPIALDGRLEEKVWKGEAGEGFIQNDPKDGEPAFVSKFAQLEGIRGIKPGRHVELMPYTVGQAQFRPEEEGNPFETGRRFTGNAGFDLKLSLKSNLTLDATVNPDFGQVEVDPAVINLSAYETYYSEKRPFFIEGASIFDTFGRGGIYMNAGFNWPSPTFFYSRRIGRAPQGYVTEEGNASIPDRSTILGAAKVTGKLGTWNVGLISALTASEFAQIDQVGARLKQEVEPFSFYGVVRAQKDIDKGRSGIGFMAIGHEMSHGFDDQGGNFDKDGNMRDWWAPEDAEKFKQQTQILVEHYGGFTTSDGVPVNGELTLGENIADYAGLTVALNAYHLSLEGKKRPEPIEGFTDDQRFFLSFAQLWRGKIRDEALKRQIQEDVHPWGEFRVNGAPFNVPEFCTIFNIQPGDKLYRPPEKRPVIW